ncbi:metal-dependent hydrolase [Candidatus Woesebacteria bacterium]|nr:metal-dependent hydrolase [Candidatus Woesebacteria bacterium]
MTGRTHDLVGFTALTYIVATQNTPHMTFATLLVAVGGNFIGSLTPDLDEATSGFWQKIPAGTFIGKLVHPLTGGHRLITHSLLGMFLIGKVLEFVLQKMGTVLLVDMNVVWISFMIGFFFHLVADSITKEGVPWLFPIPWKIGFPPFKSLRITTGAFLEKAVVFPGLLILNGFLIYNNYSKFVDFVISSTK